MAARIPRKTASRSATQPSGNGKLRRKKGTETSANIQTIGGYLIQRLQDYGIRDLFGRALKAARDRSVELSADLGAA